jgi:hypothetical protein
MKKLTIFSLFFFLFLFFPSQAQAAKLLLNPESKTVVSGQQFVVSLILDTEGKTVNGVDVELIYPQSILWVDKVEPSAVFPLHLQRILKDQGKLILNFSGNRFSGQSWLANLTLSTHTSGEGYLSFVCQQGSRFNDTNIWEAETNRELVNCETLRGASYFVEPKNAASPTPPAEACLAPEPPQKLQAKTGPGVGQVTLNWEAVTNADYYTLVYGLVSRGYIYGAPNLGRGTQYTVSGMASGRKYYFALTSVNSCGSSGYSAEVSARAGGSLPSPSPAEEKGGWPGPSSPAEVIIISPTPAASLPSSEPTASPLPGTEEAELSPSPTTEATSTAEPTAFIPPKPEPFWRGKDFWQKVALVSVALFMLTLLISFLRGKGGGKKQTESGQTLPPAEETTGWPPPEVPQEWPGEEKTA